VKEIILQPKCLNDFKIQEITKFAEIIRSAYPKYVVKVEPSEGYAEHGIPPNEILSIKLMSSINRQTLERIFTLAIDWVRGQFKTSPSKPKSIIIYDSKSKPLKEITFNNPDENPEMNLILGRTYRIKSHLKKRGYWHFFKFWS